MNDHPVAVFARGPSDLFPEGYETQAFVSQGAEGRVVLRLDFVKGMPVPDNPSCFVLVEDREQMLALGRALVLNAGGSL